MCRFPPFVRAGHTDEHSSGTYQTLLLEVVPAFDEGIPDSANTLRVVVMRSRLKRASVNYLVEQSQDRGMASVVHDTTHAIIHTVLARPA